MASGRSRLIGYTASDASISVNSVFQKDDILFGKLRPNLRKSVRAPFSGYCSTDILVLRSEQGIASSFTSHIFQWDRVFDAAAATAAGTKMPRTSWSDLQRVQVFVPNSIDEQERIACVLNMVDDGITKTEAVIYKLKQVRTGLLHDLLTLGLDENGELRDPIGHPEHFKDSPIGPIPKSWDTHPLEKVASVDRGKFGHRPRNDPALYGGGFPFIQTGDITSAAGEIIAEAGQSLSQQGVAVSRQFPAGTIAITIAANIGDTVAPLSLGSLTKVCYPDVFGNRFILTCTAPLATPITWSKTDSTHSTSKFTVARSADVSSYRILRRVPFPMRRRH